jgi:hypothetical protein
MMLQRVEALASQAAPVDVGDAGGERRFEFVDEATTGNDSAGQSVYW